MSFGRSKPRYPYRRKGDGRGARQAPPSKKPRARQGRPSGGLHAIPGPFIQGSQKPSKRPV